MKFLIETIAIILLAFVFQIFLGWWGIAVAGFIGGLMSKEGGFRGFGTGFIAIFLLWSVVAFAQMSMAGSVLPDRVAEILPLPLSSSTLAMFSGVLGGLVGGMGSLSGNWTRKAFTSN